MDVFKKVNLNVFISVFLIESGCLWLNGTLRIFCKFRELRRKLMREAVRHMLISSIITAMGLETWVI